MFEWIRERVLGKSYALPPYEHKDLGRDSAIPWKSAKQIRKMDFHEGLVSGSFHRFPSGVIYYESKFGICNDGSGGNPEGDRHHLDDTSMHDKGDRPLDPRTFPYIVLPQKKGKPFHWPEFDIDDGDLGMCFYLNGTSCPVICGERGPEWRLGEGSMFVARQLGINDDPNLGGIDATQIPPGIVHLIFPKSRRMLPKGDSDRPRTSDDAVSIASRARQLFAAFKAG